MHSARRRRMIRVIRRRRNTIRVIVCLVVGLAILMTSGYAKRPDEETVVEPPKMVVLSNGEAQRRLNEGRERVKFQKELEEKYLEINTLLDKLSSEYNDEDKKLEAEIITLLSDVLALHNENPSKLYLGKSAYYTALEQLITYQESVLGKYWEEMSTKLSAANANLDQLESAYTAENAEIAVEVSMLLEEIWATIEEFPDKFSSVESAYYKVEERLKCYNDMVLSIQEKTRKMEISGSANMKEALGFTEEELTYIILNVKTSGGKLRVTDRQLAQKLASGIVETLKEYPANEFLVLSIMSHETGFFTSKACVNKNNFGGMMVNGKTMRFDTQEDGISRATECIHNNLYRRGGTISKMGKSYCPVETGHWVDMVVGYVRLYASAVK